MEKALSPFHSSNNGQLLMHFQVSTQIGDLRTTSVGVPGRPELVHSKIIVRNGPFPSTMNRNDETIQGAYRVHNKRYRVPLGSRVCEG